MTTARGTAEQAAKRPAEHDDERNSRPCDKARKLSATEERREKARREVQEAELEYEDKLLKDALQSKAEIVELDKQV